MALKNGSLSKNFFIFLYVLFYQKLVIYIFENSLFLFFFLTATWLSHDQLWGTFEEAAVLIQ